jgi:polysaccharide export outer membrane protein
MFGSKFYGALAAVAILAAPAAWAQDKSAAASNRLMEPSGRAGGDVSGVPAVGRDLARTRPNAAEYRIGAGDVLGIEVWKEPDASSPAAPVRPDGKISLPMVGEVQAAGLTPTELESALTSKYREYIRDTHVTVVVKEINSKKIYLIGEVKKEGAIRIQAPMTVLQALAEAGGVTDYASRRKIYILRTVENRQVKFAFDYDAVVRGEKIDENITLAAGDTIVVPR